MAKKTETPAEFLPDFGGFSPKALTFLHGLAKNNDRTWFQARKETYENEVQFPMRCLVAEFARARAGDALPVHGDPAKSLFRIHRDVRFSKNKNPYKTHAGAVLSRTGGRGEQGIVYIHIMPGGCFVSAGFWRPDPALLTAWRNSIVAAPDDFLEMIDDLKNGGRPKLIMRAISALKTMPRGFAAHADAPYEEYLRWKSFLLTRPLTDKQVQGRGLVKIIRDHAERARPLLEYGWALADAPAERDPRPYQAAG